MINRMRGEPFNTISIQKKSTDEIAHDCIKIHL